MKPHDQPIAELGEFVIANKAEKADEMNRLLTAIKLASKVVNREINKAGLADILGSEGTKNVQGETQQKLDVFAHNKFIEALTNREVVCGICSEEEDDYIPVNPQATYVILMDPLDGSSNIDVNVSVGTIFSIYRRITPVGSPVNMKDFLQCGRDQIAAGYVLYGSSTMLVLTTGSGVNGFTLDPSLGTFYLSHPNLKFPRKSSFYSVNEGYFSSFPEGIQSFLRWCHEYSPSNKDAMSLRYIGSLVSDFHRNLLKGGVFLYPPTMKEKKGKLRLLYECNPMAFIAEQAGGKATDGFVRILDVEAESLHQRTPFYVGNANVVDKVDTYMTEAVNKSE